MAEYEPPPRGVAARTLIFDMDRQLQVMWLEGVLPLPPGSTVELHNASPLVNADATVERVRLLAAGSDGGAMVCLDCKVPPAWWDTLLPEE